MVRQRGMTLIEVMIALVVTTVGLLGALAMVGSLYVGSTFNRNVTEALTLAQTQIEQINSRQITMSVPVDGPPPETTETLDALGNAVAGGMFTRTTTWGTNAAQQTRRVTVAVSWTDGGGRPHSISLQDERIP
jgi:prepilin-type N-terminal cleavage/methylation domain-containing protein